MKKTFMKLKILTLLEDSCDVEYRQPLAEEMLINGSVFIYSLTPQTGTFAEFSEMTFAGKIAQFSLNHHWVDVVFDRYKPDGFKAYTRESRAKMLSDNVW